MKRILGWTVAMLVAGVLALGISWVYYAPPQEIRGTWKTDGYGLVIDITGLTINVYQSGDTYCIHDQKAPAHMGLVNLVEGVTFDITDDRLKLTSSDVLNPIYADRIAEVPAPCDTPPSNTEANVFDAVWGAMNTHYAHFDTHGIDWAARQSLRPTAGSSRDDAGILPLLKDLLAGLDDNHVYIATGTDVWSPALPTAWHDARHLVRDTTLAAVPDLSAPSATGLQVGWAAPNIGYVYMAHMAPNTGIGQRANVAASQALSQVLAYLAGADGLILDVRYNPGGSDDVAMAYAGYFTDTALPAFTKTTRTNSGYTAPFTAMLTPQPATTDIPTVVLTSPYTGSAAEIFTLAMRELPQVTTMGETTSGSLSDVMTITLPNSWELGLSHQRYLSISGDSFEHIGIPPDVTIPVDVTAAQSGQDTILDAAISLLQTR